MSGEKVRATTHNGRYQVTSNGEKQVYSTKHNDRNFDVGNATHIQPNMQVFNRVWLFDENGYHYAKQEETIDAHELEFYERHFSDALAVRNEKALAARQKNRVQTMDEYRKNLKFCAEETILQLGTSENSVDDTVLQEICVDYMEWHRATYPQAVLLDAALHVDEPNAAPHLHLRRVWVSHDEAGREIVSQKDALADMGIQPPNPSAKIDRYNNPKVTFTAECRAKFIEIAKQYGVEIELEPLEPSKSGLSHNEYVKQQIAKKTAVLSEKLEQTQQQLAQTRAEQGRAEQERDAAREEQHKAEQERDAARAEMTRMQAEKEKVEQERDAARAERDKAQSDVDVLTTAVINTVKPEKKGLFRKKTENFVISKDEYNSLLQAADSIKHHSRELVDAKTKEDSDAAERSKRQAEQLKKQQEQIIQDAVARATRAERKRLAEETAEVERLKAEMEQRILKKADEIACKASVTFKKQDTQQRMEQLKATAAKIDRTMKERQKTEEQEQGHLGK